MIPAGNLTGLPAISLPCGFADQMPIAISLVGRAFSETHLLALGRACFRAKPIGTAAGCQYRTRARSLPGYEQSQNTRPGYSRESRNVSWRRPGPLGFAVHRVPSKIQKASACQGE